MTRHVTNLQMASLTISLIATTLALLVFIWVRSENQPAEPPFTEKAALSKIQMLLQTDDIWIAERNVTLQQRTFLLFIKGEEKWEATCNKSSTDPSVPECGAFLIGLIAD